MQRKPLLWGLIGVVALVLAAGLYFGLRPSDKPAAVSTTGAPLTASTHDNGFGEQIPVQLTENKTGLDKLYQTEEIKSWYETELNDRTSLPAFNFAQDLTKKSYLDLLLLRNEIYARNGYCFTSSTLRQHFDRFKWYRPIWGIEGFRVPLSRQELTFVEKVHARELALLPNRIGPQQGYPMISIDFALNQRELLITPAMRTVLTKNNFVIVPTREEQLFYLYDQNQYAYTPTFVTTDLVLQLLHKHLNGIMSDVEEKRLVPIVTNMLIQGTMRAQALARQCQNPQARQAAEWAAAYYWIGQRLITGMNGTQISTTYRQPAEDEVAFCTQARGKGSVFLRDSLLDYNQFKPRGMYTQNDTTRRYFRAVKWLNSAPVYLDNDHGLLAAVAMAQALAASPDATTGFRTFSRVIDLLAGDEDNRSLTHLLKLLKRSAYAGKTLDELAAPETLTALRQELVAAGTDRIRAEGATEKAIEFFETPKLLFTAGRYTFDGEILSRLVDVLRPKPGAEPKRPFPKGLDVFATFGDSTARDLLLNHYRESERWPQYPDTLRALQEQFAELDHAEWDRNLYNKTMHLLLGLNYAPAHDDMLYTQTPAWRRRNLSTALAGWTELKHDLLLYTEQPNAAEAGGGGGPPPPQHLGWVEPNVTFWKRAGELIAYQEKMLNQLDLNTEHLSGINKQLTELTGKLRDLAGKEVQGQQLTAEEMDYISWIGGEVEQLTISILKTTQLPDRERHLGLVADVYAFNTDVLEEAVGAADALYVLVEINGTPVIARGAIFSYYEFKNPERLTDEEWREMLNRNPPPRPSWLQDLIVPVKELNKNEGTLYGPG